VAACAATDIGCLIACDFEVDFCHWDHKTDGLAWTRKSGDTPSPYTGPHSAKQGSYYLYIEASVPNYPNKTFALESPTFALTSSISVTFSRHMQGMDMGALYLDIKQGDSWSHVWGSVGDQGDSWEDKVVYIPAAVTQLRFVGVTGIDFQSDMAIDDVRVNMEPPPTGAPTKAGINLARGKHQDIVRVVPLRQPGERNASEPPQSIPSDKEILRQRDAAIASRGDKALRKVRKIRKRR
jgi:hypothetical protein